MFPSTIQHLLEIWCSLRSTAHENFLFHQCRGFCRDNSWHWPTHTHYITVGISCPSFSSWSIVFIILFRCWFWKWDSESFCGILEDSQSGICDSAVFSSFHQLALEKKHAMHKLRLVNRITEVAGLQPKRWKLCYLLFWTFLADFWRLEREVGYLTVAFLQIQCFNIFSHELTKAGQPTQSELHTRSTSKRARRAHISIPPFRKWKSITFTTNRCRQVGVWAGNIVFQGKAIIGYLLNCWRRTVSSYLPQFFTLCILAIFSTTFS